jgi:hypothetical protein
VQGCSLHLVKHVGKGITKFRPSAQLRTTETNKKLQAHSLCPVILRLYQCGVGIWFFVIPTLVLGSWKFFKIKELSVLGIWKKFRIKKPWGLCIWKKIGFKESLVLGISKSSKNHQVSWKNEKRLDSFKVVIWLLF